MAGAGAPLYPTETTQGHVASASLQTSLHPRTLLEPGARYAREGPCLWLSQPDLSILQGPKATLQQFCPFTATSDSFSFSVIVNVFQQNNYCYGYVLSKRNTQRRGEMLSFPTDRYTQIYSYTYILLNIQQASNLETVPFLFKLNFWYSDTSRHY